MAKRMFNTGMYKVRKIGNQWFVGIGSNWWFTKKTDAIKTKSEANMIADYMCWEECQFVSGLQNTPPKRQSSIDFLKRFNEMLWGE